MRLPAESLLDIFAFVDYGSLVFLQLTHSSFLHVCNSKKQLLAHRRAFCASFDRAGAGVGILEVLVNGQHRYIRSFPTATAEETEEALAQAETTIGPHKLLECKLFVPALAASIDELLRMFPALRSVERLDIDDLNCDAADLLSILQKFGNLKQLTLYPPPMGFRWTLLRLPIFLSLDFLSLFVEDASVRNPFDPQLIEDEVALYCSQMTSYGRSERRTVFVGDWELSRHFVDRTLA
ncbi:hypothetical protein AAVH_33966, partial [Aphelenchoides avenae]